MKVNQTNKYKIIDSEGNVLGEYRLSLAAKKALAEFKSRGNKIFYKQPIKLEKIDDEV